MRRMLAVTCLVAGLVAGLPPAAADDPPPTQKELQTSADNLKQIGLAFHKYADVNGHFPNNVYDDGKARLSWRVLILPYLEEAALFRQIKLDEAWDSPANKALVEKMPKVFAPVRGKAKAGETFYRGFVTPRGPFGPTMGKGIKFAAFRDGLSNTVLVIEAGEAVPWTKPDDMEVPAKGALPKLGGMFGGAAQMVMADGWIVRVRADPDPVEMRKLIDPNDALAVDFDKLRVR